MRARHTDPVITQLSIRLLRVGRRSVLAVGGEIDINSATDLSHAADQALDAGAHELWVDLTDVTFMDSAGVHALIAVRTRVLALERQLVVVCPPGAPRRTLALSGLEEALRVFDTREAAHRAG